MKLTILIPAYNEQDTIEKVINRLLNLSVSEKEIIIIDDGSTDRTREILSRFKVRSSGFKVIFHEKNYGKGKAIQTGLKYATGDIVCINDADLEYNPNEIPKLLDQFHDSSIDAVYGSRFLKKNPNIYKRYLWGNKFITFLINLFCGTNYTDSYTGYKFIRKNIFDKLALMSKRFEIETEISVKLAKMNSKIREIPITYNPRTLEEGKKIRFIDGFKAVLTILKYL